MSESHPRPAPLLPADRPPDGPNAFARAPFFTDALPVRGIAGGQVHHRERPPLSVDPKSGVPVAKDQYRSS